MRDEMITKQQLETAKNAIDLQLSTQGYTIQELVESYYDGLVLSYEDDQAGCTMKQIKAFINQIINNEISAVSIFDWQELLIENIITESLIAAGTFTQDEILLAIGGDQQSSDEDDVEMNSIVDTEEYNELFTPPQNDSTSSHTFNQESFDLSHIIHPLDFLGGTSGISSL
jgi:hypothetical protein